MSPSMDNVHDVPPNSTTSSSLDTSHITTTGGFNDQFIILTDSQTTALSDVQLISSISGPIAQQDRDRALSKFDYTQMADICVCFPIETETDVITDTQTRYNMSHGSSMIPTPRYIS